MASTTTTSPNMTLLLPNPTQDPGPDWATLIYNALQANIDQHDHSNGKGVQINATGINISSPFTLNNNELTAAQLIQFYVQNSAPSAIGCLYVLGVDLYYIDVSGNVVRITQSGSVTGSSGTITGLPSGTASASFASSAFTFQSATATPAAMNVGPVAIGAQVANAKTVTLQASSSQSSDIALTLPTALPSVISILSLDSSGNIGVLSQTGSGVPVFSTNPTISGAALSSPTISGAGITTSTLDSTPVGATTPSTGAFTTMAVGSGPTFKMQRFTGTGLAASGSVILLFQSNYTNFYGAIGKTTVNGSTNDYYPLENYESTIGCYVFQNNITGIIYIQNASSSHQNNYDVTLFFD